MTIRDYLRKTARAATMSACLVYATLAAGCASPPELSIDALMRDPARYVDRPVVLTSCIQSSRHAFALTSCTDDALYLAIRQGDVPDEAWSGLRAYALASWSRDRRRRVTLEGTLKRSATANANVFIVDGVVALAAEGE